MRDRAKRPLRRGCGGPSEATADLKTVKLGEHQIENDEIRGRVFDALQSFKAGACGAALKPLTLQVEDDGETREVTLAPLESGGESLVVRVPLGAGRYLLIENRQLTGLAAVLPSSGLLILEVNEDREEGTDVKRAGVGPQRPP